MKRHLFRWFRKKSLQQSRIFRSSSFIFKSQPKNTQKYPYQAFLIQNFKIFIFTIRQFWGCWFQIWQPCFQIPVQHYPNKAFSVLNWRIFIFARNLAFRKFELVDFEYEISFSNSSQDICKYFYIWMRLRVLKVSGYWFRRWQ